MADDPREHEDEDDDHNGDYAKRYDHIYLTSAGGCYLSEEPPWTAFSIFSRLVSRFAPSWSAFS